jgi:hypothetical protein
LPRRWIVERTFSWLGQNRRMSKDYERLPQSAEALIYVAMSRLMLRRLITFASDRDGDFDIYTMDADGSDVAQVTTN